MGTSTIHDHGKIDCRTSSSALAKLPSAGRSGPHAHLLERPGRAHLIGIGGSGMRSLAILLASAGWEVRGSDEACVSFPESAAPEHPIQLQLGHAPENVAFDADLVIYSSAIPYDNCERQAAHALGICELSYPEVLGHLQTGRVGVGIAGTHGKSTTTAMLVSILNSAGEDPTAVLGAVPVGAAAGSRWGAGPHVVVEACEYQQNFLNLNCAASAILNIEWDHCDTYPDAAAVQQAFAKFAARLPSDGLLVVNQQCERAREAARATSARCVTFGLQSHADWTAVAVRAEQGAYRFRIVGSHGVLAAVQLQVPGRHNLLNALAAAALAAELGTPAAAIRHGLEQFAGLERRCQTLGTTAGVTLVDDYAHHPSELRATLETMRAQYPGRRLWCVFQPHQAIRTAAMLDEFAGSLHNADAVLVADIFEAREPRRSNVTSAQLAARVPRGPRVCEAISARPELVQRLLNAIAPGDVVLACGAGDIGKVLHGLRERL